MRFPSQARTGVTYVPEGPSLGVVLVGVQLRLDVSADIISVSAVPGANVLDARARSDETRARVRTVVTSSHAATIQVLHAVSCSGSPLSDDEPKIEPLKVGTSTCGVNMLLIIPGNLLRV